MKEYILEYLIILEYLTENKEYEMQVISHEKFHGILYYT